MEKGLSHALTAGLMLAVQNVILNTDQHLHGELYLSFLSRFAQKSENLFT